MFFATVLQWEHEVLTTGLPEESAYVCVYLIFMYLAAPNLSCGTWDFLGVACGVFSCDMHTLSCGMWDLVPWPGIKLEPLHWELGVLATGPPGESQLLGFWMFTVCWALLWDSCPVLLINPYCSPRNTIPVFYWEKQDEGGRAQHPLWARMVVALWLNQVLWFQSLWVLYCNAVSVSMFKESWCCLVAKLCPSLCEPMDCSPPGSSVVGFPRQEYCSGLPFPSPGDLPDSGIGPISLSLLHCRRILYPK